MDSESDRHGKRRQAYRAYRQRDRERDIEARKDRER